MLVAKAPGQAKSRLANALGAAAAARLADAFLRDTVSACRRASIDELVISYAPVGESSYFRALDTRARLAPQVAGDLGERLRAAFADAFAAGAACVVAIGGDTPHITPEAIDGAFEQLETAPAVVGRADDGGYYLIGLRKRADRVFEEIAWSTPRVYTQTAERARELGLTLAHVAESFDVDEPADLARLRELCAREPGLCPRTAALLCEL
jgi:hypothetical protein